LRAAELGYLRQQLLIHPRDGIRRMCFSNAATFSIPNASPSGIPAVFNIVMVWKLANPANFPPQKIRPQKRRSCFK
jgi:hypothetical protein